ncbi:TPA: hypothetical protein DCZ32_00975 [Candidatus Uhrbacteria bacterium]|nr:hypothetical protein [Candidatus Uhrbacteria bacterium]
MGAFELFKHAYRILTARKRYNLMLELADKLFKNCVERADWLNLVIPDLVPKDMRQGDETRIQQIRQELDDHCFVLSHAKENPPQKDELKIATEDMQLFILHLTRIQISIRAVLNSARQKIQNNMIAKIQTNRHAISLFGIDLEDSGNTSIQKDLLLRASDLLADAESCMSSDYSDREFCEKKLPLASECIRLAFESIEQAGNKCEKKVHHEYLN